MGYGFDPNSLNANTLQTGYQMPVDSAQTETYAPATSSESKAQKTTDIFNKATHTKGAEGGSSVVVIDDKNAIAAMRDKGSDKQYTIDQQTINTLVDAVMQELHPEEKPDTALSSASIKNAQDTLAKKQEKFDALPPESKGSEEWNKAKEKTYEGTSIKDKEARADAKSQMDVAKSRYHQASRQAIDGIVRYVFENKNSSGDGDLYLRSDTTQLAVPVTITEKGDVIIALKDKLGDKLGQGGFKSVKLALVLSFDTKESLQVSVKTAVSATMSPKSELDKRAVQIEKNMLLRLQELSKDDPPQGIVESMTVTSYANKNSNAPGEKIAVVMSLCNGGDLDAKVKDPLHPGESKQVAQDILTGLSWLHKNNIFHSDMKPANVLLHESNDQTQAKLGDFGCSLDLANAKERVYSAGDMQYISPEIAQMHTTMLEKMQQDPEYPDLVTKRETFSKTEKSLGDCSEDVALKLNAFEKASENGKPEEIEIANRELLEAKSNFKAVHESYTTALNDRNSLEEKIIGKYRTEVYTIDKSILKSDVYATGIIFETLFMGMTPAIRTLLNTPDDLLTDKQLNKKEKYLDKIQQREARLSPELKELIKAMKEPDVEKRISSQDALERFQEISDIYVEETDDTESGAEDDMTSAPVYGFTDPTQPFMGGGGYGLPVISSTGY